MEKTKIGLSQDKTKIGLNQGKTKISWTDKIRSMVEGDRVKDMSLGHCAYGLITANIEETACLVCGMDQDFS